MRLPDGVNIPNEIGLLIDVMLKKNYNDRPNPTDLLESFGDNTTLQRIQEALEN